MVKPNLTEILPTHDVYSHIDQKTADIIAHQFGTPIFIMHEQGILNRFRAFNNAVTKHYSHAKVAISYKTNLISGLLALLHHEGALPEVVSGIEYNVALKIRQKNQPIIFNGPMKKDHELTQAIQDGALINCDHSDEVIRIEQIAKVLQKRVPIGIRIYFNDDKDNWNRFGFPVSLNLSQQPTIDLIKRIIASPNLQFAGIHTHIGTNIRDIQIFSQLSQRLNQFTLELKQHLNIELQWIDVGGGLAGISPRIDEHRLLPHPLPNAEEYAKAIIKPLQPYLSSLKNPATLFFEPGRTIFEAFGSLLTRVVGKRDQDASGIPGYICDAGINTLSTSYVYNFPIQTFATSNNINKAYLYGPTCMQNDQLHTPTELPLLQSNDLLLFHGVGSYCMAFSYSFIRLKPGVVLLRDNNEITWLRQPETLEHYAALEHLPDHVRYHHVTA
jgi:diaminopimelate decarboxylase